LPSLLPRARNKKQEQDNKKRQENLTHAKVSARQPCWPKTDFVTK